MQAVQNCEKIAYDYGNQELAQGAFIIRIDHAG